MRKHLKYLRYLALHKWYVFVECLKRGLFWQGVFHDMSKCKIDEWMPYVEHFEGKMKHTVLRGKQENSGADIDFEEAWQRHIRRNPHHPEYWVLTRMDGSKKAFDMPERYRLEMLCDWIGANKAQGGNGKDTLREWYGVNRGKILLGEGTRAWLEEELGKL